MNLFQSAFCFLSACVHGVSVSVGHFWTFFTMNLMPESLFLSSAKTWWEFPKPTFFYCQEFCPRPIFSWLRLLEGEKYWNKSHHRLFSPHCHCWWCWHCLRGVRLGDDTSSPPPPHEKTCASRGGMETDRLQRYSFIQQLTHTICSALSETCHKQNKSVLEIVIEIKNSWRIYHKQQWYYHEVLLNLNPFHSNQTEIKPKSVDKIA